MANVRTHSRHTRGSGTTTVHRHDRSNRGKTWDQLQKKPRRRRSRRGLQARRGFRNLGRAFRYGRRRKQVAAFACGAAGTFELGAWAVSRGTMAVGICAFALCALAVVPVVWAVVRT